MREVERYITGRLEPAELCHGGPASDMTRKVAVVLAPDYDALAAENARLRAELAAVREQQAIARRAADRIVQLCTTPHESKERFIRRVQSVIEWEAQAISADASP